MSLYRQSGGSGWRVVAVAAVVALLVGGGIGYAIGRSTAPEPSLAEQVADLQGRLQPTLDGLTLVPDHYAQGIKAGGEVQYDGAVQQATAARDGFTAESGDLQALDPALTPALVLLAPVRRSRRGPDRQDCKNRENSHAGSCTTRRKVRHASDFRKARA